MSFKGHYPEWHTVLLLAFYWPECSQIGNVFFGGCIAAPHTTGILFLRGR